MSLLPAGSSACSAFRRRACPSGSRPMGCRSGCRWSGGRSVRTRSWPCRGCSWWNRPGMHEMVGGDRVKVQRVEMFVCPMATPNDTSRLQELIDGGRVKPDSLVALVGKTEGTGFHDDWGRVLADIALREWAARRLGIPVG